MEDTNTKLSNRARPGRDSVVVVRVVVLEHYTHGIRIIFSQRESAVQSLLGNRQCSVHMRAAYRSLTLNPLRNAPAKKLHCLQTEGHAVMGGRFFHVAKQRMWFFAGHDEAVDRVVEPARILLG